MSTYFSKCTAAYLSEFCIFMEERLFGLSQNDVCWLDVHLAKQNGIKHTLSKEKEAAGRKYLDRFLTRNPELCQNNTGPVFSRSNMFTPEAVTKFYMTYLNKHWTE